jgi:hypothetical protein
MKQSIHNSNASGQPVQGGKPNVLKTSMIQEENKQQNPEINCRM